MDTLSQYASLASLIFFFGVFVGICVWALNPRNKQTLQSHGEIPFKEEN